MIIAIDGPAASGKGTIARRIAAHYRLPHLDTGLLYRAVAAALIAEDRDLYDEAAAFAAARGLGLTDFSDSTLRTRQMGEAASVVAAMPGVRAALIEAQRAFAAANAAMQKTVYTYRRTKHGFERCYHRNRFGTRSWRSIFSRIPDC